MENNPHLFKSPYTVAADPNICLSSSAPSRASGSQFQSSGQGRDKQRKWQGCNLQDCFLRNPRVKPWPGRSSLVCNVPCSSERGGVFPARWAPPHMQTQPALGAGGLTKRPAKLTTKHKTCCEALTPPWPRHMHCVWVWARDVVCTEAVHLFLQDGILSLCHFTQELLPPHLPTAM